MDLQGGMILRALRRLRGGVRRGSFALAVFCAAAFLPSFAALAGTYTWSGGASGTLTDAAKWTPALQGTFSADDELVINDAAEITLNAAATVGKITVNATGAVRFLAPGGAPFTIGSVENAGAGAVTFDCATHFSGTYYVTQNGTVSFPGGATATYPDNALRTASSTARTRTLNGDFTFTADWTVNNAGDVPWIIPDGSTVRGQRFGGTQTGYHRILRVEEGGSAYFTTVTNGTDRGSIDINGYLEASVEVIVETPSSGDAVNVPFGQSGNTGTVKAPRIAKTGHRVAQTLIPNLIVGAGGIGALVQDYIWRFDVDATITFTEDCNILGVYRSAGLHDWGIGCSGTRILTFNVLEGKTVTYGTGFSGTTCAIRKTGKGTLVMTNTYNGNTGFIKQYANGTVIEDGTVRLAANGQLGTGAVTIGANGTLEILNGVTVSNQVDGEGTLVLNNGATLTMGTVPWRVGAVEVAAGATVNVTTTSGCLAPFTFLTGVNAANAGNFVYDQNTLAVIDNNLVWTTDTTGVYVWNGASGADWSAAANWLVDGAVPATAPAATDTILFQNTAPVTIGGTDTLTISNIVTLSGELVTFSCPVQFADTYLVENAATAPLFAGGATATYADDSLTNLNIPSHALSGTITFTQDWSIPQQQTPFVLTEGSTLTGKKLTAMAYTSSKPELRIDEGAVATFDSIPMAKTLVFWLNGGRLVSNGDITIGGATRDFGYYSKPNIGTVEAHGIYKDVTGLGAIYNYVTNMVVGAGGFGMYRKDYYVTFYVDSKLTAKDDLTIYKPVAADNPTDNNDWGLNLNSHTFTINTDGHTVTFDAHTFANAGVLVKDGAGEIIMTGLIKKHTGGTVVREGLMTVTRDGGLGNGPVTVENGATLANTAVVAIPSTLTLQAGAILKPTQNTYLDFSGGSVVTPAAGTVSVDMTGFTFVNGVANPVLGGVAAGDEAKFTALVPAGVSGAFSVSGGFLYYTATAGGSAAADLFWHPAGDPTWSAAVAAWTNAAGEQVAFSPYANVTVADAATITLSENVDANDVTVSADGDVTLNGTGKIGGPGAIVKTGAGTFTFNATGGIEAQPIIVSNGTFRLGDDLPTRALGATVDTSPIIVENGGTLDINYRSDLATNPQYDPVRVSLTHDKLIKIAGDGVDGKGAIINTNKQTYFAFSDVELTDDATIGGTVRADFRHSASYGSIRGTTKNTLTGEGKRLTVKNTAKLVLVGTTINLGSILVTDNGVLEFENPAVQNIPGGIHLQNGTFSFYGGSGSADVIADSGDNYMKNNNGTATFSGKITVSPGATLTQTAGNILYTNPSTPLPMISGGIAMLDGCVPANGFTLSTAKASEAVRLRQGGTFTGANISCNSFGIADVSNSVVDVTFLDSTLDVNNLYLGWGSAWASAALSVGPGTTLTAGNFSIGYDGTVTNQELRSAVSVDGGTVHVTGADFFIAHNGPHSDFVLNSGTVTVDQATIRLRNGTDALGGYNTARFIQNGGTFNYGGSGFMSKSREDNTEGGQIVLKGGEFNATANWAIPYYIPLYFKEGDADGWTLNQTDGTTATWTTALLGNGDVTLNGAATLVGNKEVQGPVGGKWTIGDGFTAGLEGASSLLGGLELGEGASASVNIATNRCAVFTARDGSDEFHNAGCITNRFNWTFGGTTRGTITHDENFLLTKYVKADRPFGGNDVTHGAFYAVGQFYVEPEKAGKWYFKGYCDDYIQLVIDGETVLSSVGDTDKCVTYYGTNELASGWHTFRQIATDVDGSFGGNPSIGYNTNGSSSYTAFSVKTLKMRPAADNSDPNNANTIRWSHYKQPDTTSWKDTDKYKANDLDWDFCCITNNLQMLQWYGGTDPVYLNTHVVNRFDGWFLVTKENADKEWTFRTQYDDNCALWIDGVDTGLTGASGNTLTYKVTLARGWHRFEIRTYDNTGNAGPWSGNGLAVSYQVAGGAQTLFSEQTLALTVCPDGYVQGGVTLASDATLTNTAGGTDSVPSTAAVIYGGVTATGTGATMSGPFKFEGGKLAFQNVAPNTHELAEVLAFENPAQDFLANVGEITVDFTDTPTRGKIAICPLGGMTQAAVEAKLAVTVNGEPFDKFQLLIENGTVYLNKGGTVIMVR